ncbi:MAG: hypothetical protein VZQ61_02850 [Christensenellaceae bacterium]
MNEPKTEQTEELTQTEKVNETETAASVSLGKFKDVNALLNASEFTKRCQRIKELEAEKSAAVDKSIPTEKSEETENRVSGITDEDKENFLKGYLKEIMGARSKAIVMDGFGTGVKTPVNKPRTVEEAGALAKEMLAK